MKYYVTTKEPMIIISTLEIDGNYNSLTFKKIDEHHAYIECDGELFGINGFECIIEKI